LLDHDENERVYDQEIRDTLLFQREEQVANEHEQVEHVVCVYFVESRKQDDEQKYQLKNRKTNEDEVLPPCGVFSAQELGSHESLDLELILVIRKISAQPAPVEEAEDVEQHKANLKNRGFEDKDAVYPFVWLSNRLQSEEIVDIRDVVEEEDEHLDWDVEHESYLAELLHLVVQERVRDPHQQEDSLPVMVHVHLHDHVHSAHPAQRIRQEVVSDFEQRRVDRVQLLLKLKDIGLSSLDVKRICYGRAGNSPQLVAFEAYFVIELC
jgi:hypothetical protein